LPPLIEKGLEPRFFVRQLDIPDHSAEVPWARPLDSSPVRNRLATRMIWASCDLERLDGSWSAITPVSSWFDQSFHWDLFICSGSKRSAQLCM